MTAQPLNVLFLCTGNSARSIIGETLLNSDPSGRFRAFSAGSTPAGKVHPRSVEILTEHGHDVSGARSKNWDEFADDEAPTMDVVITVCDNAANETCPFWPGAPLQAHWGIPDPAAITEPNDEQRAAFELAYQRMKSRVDQFTQLDWANLTQTEKQAALRKIGEFDMDRNL